MGTISIGTDKIIDWVFKAGIFVVGVLCTITINKQNELLTKIDVITIEQSRQHDADITHTNELSYHTGQIESLASRVNKLELK